MILPPEGDQRQIKTEPPSCLCNFYTDGEVGKWRTEAAWKRPCKRGCQLSSAPAYKTVYEAFVILMFISNILNINTRKVRSALTGGIIKQSISYVFVTDGTDLHVIKTQF